MLFRLLFCLCFISFCTVAQQPDDDPLFDAQFDAFGYEIDSERNSFSPAGDRYAKFCTPTPQIQSYAYPGKQYVHPGNSLARPGGKSDFAPGERLYLTGRIFDSACVPLRDAKVEIWHTDSDGDYRIADKADIASPYALFAGAGFTKTNNLGEFEFETIMPGVSKITQPPIINIRVSHPSMRTPLTSTIYFKGENRNPNSLRFKRLSATNKELVTAIILPLTSNNLNAGFRAHHDITVRARDGFRGF